MAAPRAAKLRSKLSTARRLADSAQQRFLRAEDIHADLAEREARRADRERTVEDPNVERFPQLDRRRPT
jgi:hypothetical protein